MSKYHSRKVKRDDMIFDSTKEYKRFCELRLLERAGAITELERQVKYVLIPVQREPDKRGPRGGVKAGKLLEREVAYYADFVYRDESGVLVVEDTKGMRTADYIIKRKLMLFMCGIRVREV